MDSGGMHPASASLFGTKFDLFDPAGKIFNDGATPQLKFLDCH